MFIYTYVCVYVKLRISDLLFPEYINERIIKESISVKFAHEHKGKRAEFFHKTKTIIEKKQTNKE